MMDNGKMINFMASVNYTTLMGTYNMKENLKKIIMMVKENIIMKLIF